MTVRIDLSAMESRFGDAEAEKRQELFAMKAASLIRKYVPVEETTLRSSEPMNSDYRGGVLVWDTPYAARHFYVPVSYTHLDVYKRQPSRRSPRWGSPASKSNTS